MAAEMPFVDYFLTAHAHTKQRHMQQRAPLVIFRARSRGLEWPSNDWFILV